MVLVSKEIEVPGELKLKRLEDPLDQHTMEVGVETDLTGVGDLKMKEDVKQFHEGLVLRHCLDLFTGEYQRMVVFTPVLFPVKAHEVPIFKQFSENVHFLDELEVVVKDVLVVLIDQNVVVA
jgi:hypothetical protein